MKAKKFIVIIESENEIKMNEVLIESILREGTDEEIDVSCTEEIGVLK
jgi:phosphoribosylformimino-5-aminoimidazole carboxamide ribonucleotide (ProFAR) isomerase